MDPLAHEDTVHDNLDRAIQINAVDTPVVDPDGGPFPSALDQEVLCSAFHRLQRRTDVHAFDVVSGNDRPTRFQSIGTGSCLHAGATVEDRDRKKERADDGGLWVLELDAHGIPRTA